MDTKKKLIVLVLSVLLFLNIFISSQAIVDDEDLYKPIEIKDGSTLNIIQCVGLAFQKSPKIRRKMYELFIAKSETNIAKAQYFPELEYGVGYYQEHNSNHIYYDKKYRDLPAINVKLKQLIWNFGKTTSFIKMQKFYQIAAEYEFMDSLCDTLFDIKVKYYNLLKAKALLNVAKNNIRLNEDILKYTKKDNKVDYQTAIINLSAAKIDYIEAKNNFDNAKVDLSNAMYIDTQPDYDIELTPTFTYNDDFKYGNKYIEHKTFEPYQFPFKKDEALKIAYENNPDLVSLNSVKSAMQESLKFIQKTYLPDLSLTTGYGFNNTNFTDNNRFEVGVELSGGVNLMELKNSIKGADAQLKLADNEIKLFKKDLYFELIRAFNNIERAQNQVPTAMQRVQEAIKNFEITETGYKKGTLNYISLQDARKNYINALNSYIDSIYNYNISLIQLEMAMHYHLIDIHHKSEHALVYHADELEEHLSKVLECNEREIRPLKQNLKKQNKKLNFLNNNKKVRQN